jgi:hypothetical protein
MASIVGKSGSRAVGWSRSDSQKDCTTQRGNCRVKRHSGPDAIKASRNCRAERSLEGFLISRFGLHPALSEGFFQ